MCGGCGRHATDPVSAVLLGSYARTVVAKLCSDLRDGVRVTTGPVGWTVTCRGRRPALATTVPELARVLASGVVSSAIPLAFPELLAAAVDRQPPHRQLPVPEFTTGTPTTWIYTLTAHALSPVAA